MSKPAYIYARFSSQEQGQGHSLKRQLEGARRHIRENRWEYPGLDNDEPDFSKSVPERDYTDEGKSAFSGANRSAGGALYEFERKVAQGHFRNGAVLVVENVDRLTRQGWDEALSILKSLTENGVSIATVQKGRFFPAHQRIKLEDVMMIVIEAELAHEESFKKAKRLRDSWADRIKAIQNGDRRALSKVPPQWIDVDLQTYEMSLNPHRSKVLTEIFEWYANGYGLPKIVEILNARGERSWAYGKKNKGNGWNTAYLHKLLTNRAVLGEFEPMSRTHGGNNETSKGIRVPDYYPQAITPELFNRCIAQRATRQRFGGSQVNKLHNLFAGLVTCQHCGAPMYFQSQQLKGRITGHRSKRDGRKLSYVSHTSRSYLMCNNRRRSNQVRLKGDEFGQCVNIGKPRYEYLEQAVLNTVLSLAMNNLSFMVPDRVAELEAQLAELERLIEDKQFQLNNLAENLKERVSRILANQLADLEEDIGSKESRAQEMRRNLEREKGQASPEEHLERVREVRASLDSKDNQTRYEARLRVMQALRAVITMSCDKDGVTTVMLAGELMAWKFDNNGELIGHIDNRLRLDLQRGMPSTHIEEVLARSNKPQRKSVDPMSQQWRRSA